MPKYIKTNLQVGKYQYLKKYLQFRCNYKNIFMKYLIDWLYSFQYKL